MKKVILCIFYQYRGCLLWGGRSFLLTALYIFSLTVQAANTVGHPEIIDVVNVDVSECPGAMPGYQVCYKYSWQFLSDDIPGNIIFPKGKFDVLVNSSGDNYLQTNAPWSFGVPGDFNVSWNTLIQTMTDRAGKSGEGYYAALANWKGCFTFGVSNNATSHILPGTRCFRAPPPDVSCNFNLEKIYIDFGTLNPKSINGAQQSLPVNLSCTNKVTAEISNLDKGNITLHNENSAGITADLSVNGSSLAKDQTLDLSSGDNALNIMATLKSDGDAPAGDYSASTILSVSLQ